MLDTLAKQARAASIALANLSTEQKNEVLLKVAKELRKRQSEILEANDKDCYTARQKLDQGLMSNSLYKRLVLDEKKIEQMALNMESVASLEDPVGKLQGGTMLDHNLNLYRVSCPIGVLLVIFEARPEVVIQISALSLKSANAVILKGGSEAAKSNRALARIIDDVLCTFPDIPSAAVSLLESREDVSKVIKMDQYIDLVIPRGSNQLVQSIQSQSNIPMLAHADGICHVFLEKDADYQKALDIAIDAKTEYPAVCNAMETLLVHQEFSDEALGDICFKLQEKGVELRLCLETQRRLQKAPSLNYLEAKEDDWRAEYTDLILSIKSVSSIKEAVDHINNYGSHHTDSIITEDSERAEWFMNQVDSASVFWNASTRFADGFRYGFGAEVGISTSRTHARGPVGLEGLVIYKYKLYGNGDCVIDYSKGKKTFKHDIVEK